MYKVEAEAIIGSMFNNLAGLSPESVPPAGEFIVIPDGVAELPSWDWTPEETINPDCNNRIVDYAPGHPGSCGEIELPSDFQGYQRWVRPLHVISTVSQLYNEEWHPGMDLVVSENIPVFAVDDGVVVFSGWNSWGYGNLVAIDHGNSWVSLYAHLDDVLAACGEKVTRGYPVGMVGSTGNSTGPHLHFELHLNNIPVDPARYIELEPD